MLRLDSAFRPLLLIPLALATACSEERWQTPSPDSPAVTVALPQLLQDLRGSSDDPFFGDSSTELSLTVVAQAPGGTNRTLSLGYPGRAALQGYGKHAGETEVLRKSTMLDEYGIHTVRTATYRTNAQGEHTNVWYTYLAKDSLGTIYATQIAQWDWMRGDEELSPQQLGAWPIFFELSGSLERMDRPIGLIPGTLDGQLTATYILSTDAVAPTSGIGDCSLYGFDGPDAGRRYLAYVHEQFGIVEVVYTWEFADELTDPLFAANELRSPSVYPIDGFSLVRGSISEPAPHESTESELAGTWQTRFAQPAGDSESQEPLTLQIELGRIGDHYDSERESYDLVGRAQHPRLGTFELFGRYHAISRRFSMRSGSRTEELRIEGRYEPNLEQDALLRLHSVQVVELVEDEYAVWSGQVELRRTSTGATL